MRSLVLLVVLCGTAVAQPAKPCFAGSAKLTFVPTICVPLRGKQTSYRFGDRRGAPRTR